MLLLFLTTIAWAEPCTEAGPVAACEAACQGEAQACIHLAALALVVGDAEAARAAWARGCGLGDARACQLLASVEEPESEHTPSAKPPQPPVHQAPPVEELAEKDLPGACARGSGEACFKLATAAREAPVQRARLLQACALDHAIACERLKALSHQPHRMPRSR